MADITPIYRKEDPLGRTDFRFVNILPLFRSSCSAVFSKQGFVYIFAKFTGKHQ